MFQGSLSSVFRFQPAWSQHAGAQPEMTVLCLGWGPELLSRNLEITVRLLWIFLEQKYLLSYCLLTFFLLSLTYRSVCWTVCDPVDCSPPGSSVHGDSPDKYWSGLPCLPPEDLPNPRIRPRSPALQADSLPSEPPGKPMSR